MQELEYHPNRNDLFNLWGTRKSDIDPSEYCQECEQDVRLGHYNSCPTRN